MPSVRQVAPTDGSLDALARLGYCTTKVEGKWVIRNSRSLEVVEGLTTYDDPWEAQQVCDHLNTAVKNMEIELMTGFTT